MRGFSLPGIFFSWKNRFSFGPDVRRKFYSDLASILRTDSSMSPVQIRLAIDEFRRLPSAPKVALREISAGLGRGLDFSQALRNLAPETEVMILTAAEETGDPRVLVHLLKTLAKNMEEVRKIRKSFISAVQYPAVLMFNTGGLVVYLSDSVVPKLFSSFGTSEDKLFGTARFSYEAFQFIAGFWPLIIFLPAGILLLVFVSLRADFPGRKLLDRLPPWSIYRMLVGTEFLTGLSAMLTAGIPVIRAFDQIRRRAPPYLRARIEPVMRIYKRTGKLGEAMERVGNGFPSQEVIVRLSIREKYGDLGVALAEFSNDWKEEGLPTIENQARILHYGAMILVGGSIGFLMFGVWEIVQQSMGRFGI
ncbi:MAG: Putative type IV pilus biosynthesis protein [Leptospirillum sp. Group II 'C75']|jgi:type II secretory pathway component PulF|nr:MAG: Putative type IV pilus biosynthesis protein [Leptospirillum sp. Group II 'C75']